MKVGVVRSGRLTAHFRAAALIQSRAAQAESITYYGY